MYIYIYKQYLCMKEELKIEIKNTRILLRIDESWMAHVGLYPQLSKILD